MAAFEVGGQCVQIGVADTEPLHLLHGGEHVVAAGARPAMTLSRIVQLFREAQPSGVLAMSPIDDITQRMHAFLRVVVEPNPPPSLTIDLGYLFAGAQVFDCFRAPGRGHPVSDAAAVAAAIQSEHQAWSLRSSAMHERIDAQRAMGAHKACAAPLKEVESGPPHQRPIGEDPQVLVALIGACLHRNGGQSAADVRVTGCQFPCNPQAAGAERPYSPGFEVR